MKFGFITDTHFDYKYESRKDNTLKILIDKLEQCYAEFIKQGCDFVIHGGDMFDRHRIYNFDLIRDVRNIMKKSGLVTYFILGQHDAQGYNKKTMGKSNLGFVSDISDDTLVFIDDYIETSDFMIYAAHVSEKDVIKRINSIKKQKKPTICVCHALLTDKKEAFGTISIQHIKNPNVNLVLSGDLHDGYPMTTVNGTQCYNPGAFARTEKGMRLPKVGILTWTGEQFNLKEFYPACPKCEDIFYWEDELRTAEVKKDVEGVNFISAFQEFHDKSTNAFDLLLKIGEKQQINKEVLEMIKVYKDRMKIS